MSGRTRRQPLRVLLVAAVFGMVAAAASAVAEQQTPDEPFSAPQYLMHVVGHSTMDGFVEEDYHAIHPMKPEPTQGPDQPAPFFFLVADGSGGTFNYFTDSFTGPFMTPREVCEQARTFLASSGGIVGSLSGQSSIDCNTIVDVPTTSASATAPPAETTSSVAGSTPSTEPAPTCNVRGRVVDYFGAPVPDIQITLRAGGLSLDTASLADGSYEFPEIGDDPGGGVFDSRSDPVRVAIVTEEFAHDPHRFIVYYRQKGAVLQTAPFLIPQDGNCERDFDMRAIPADYVSTGPPLSEWPDMMQIFQGIRRAWTLADDLGIVVDDGLPLGVLAYCDDASLNCSQSSAFFVGSTASGTQVVDRPFIAFGEAQSRLLSLDWPDNREYHEFGHYVLANAFGGNPDSGSDANHGGYENSSSTDSWTEGFAEFWASMVAKHVDARQRPEIYQWNLGRLPADSPNAPPVPGSNLLDPWQAWVDEEFAVASLLVRLESLDASATPTARTPRTLEVTGHTEIDDPVHGRLVVGTVVNTTPDGASIGTKVGAYFLNDARQSTSAVFGATIPANLGANGGKGVFVLPVPKDATYTSVAVNAFEGRVPRAAPPPPPLDVTLAEIWSAINVYQSPKPASGGHIKDVEDLYQALKANFGGRGTVVDGLDTIDQLFVEHGFFADVDGDLGFVPGDPIGVTSHPGRDPRTAYEGHEEQVATISLIGTAGAVPGALVYAQVDYPSPREEESYGYVVAPDDAGKVMLAIPPPASDAMVTLIGVADGYTPAVLGTVDAASFWDAVRLETAQPMTFGATMQPGDFEIPDGVGVVPTTLPATTIAASVLGSTVAGSTVPGSNTGGRDGDGGIGGVGIGVILLVGGVAARLAFTVARRRRAA